MTSLESVIGTLRAQEPALRAMGVSLAAVFGSIARGEATDRSDIDVLVELDPARRLSLFEFNRDKALFGRCNWLAGGPRQPKRC
jgi:predicted nucleotidyltransferase